MMLPSLSTTAWKRLIALLVACVVVLLYGEIGSAFGPLRSGYQGDIGIEFDGAGHLGPWGHDNHRLCVLEPDPQQLGKNRCSGREIVFERPLDRWRRFGIGEPVTLRMYDAGQVRTVTIRAQAVRVPFADYFDFLGRFLLSVPALLFCLLIGWLKPVEHSYRQLALCFLVLSLNAFYTFNYSSGPLFAAGKLINMMGYGLIWYFVASFGLAYQPYDPTPLRCLLRGIFPWYRMLAIACSVYALWFGLGKDAPGLSLLVQACVAGGLALGVASLVDGMRQTRGNLRIRHKWLLLAFACGALPSALTQVPMLDAGYRDVHFTVMASFGGLLLMYCILVYAVLRHRVFEFDPHTLSSQITVVSVASVLVLFLFALVDHEIGKLLGFKIEHEFRRTVLKVLAMLPVLFLLHHIHDKVELWVEHMLFQAAHERDKALQEFVRRAVHFTSTEALLAALVTALDRFSRSAGAAVYLARDGGLRLAVSTLWQAPPVLALDPIQRAALERDPNCNCLEGVSELGELVLPMCHRGALHGVVVLGLKSGKDGYRPNERNLLAHAVQQVGLDLDTMHVDELEAHIDTLTRETQLQELELRLVAGRRHGVRQAIGAVAGGVSF